jgi:hypothetical protein
MGLLGDALSIGKSLFGGSSSKIKYDPYAAAENVKNRQWQSEQNEIARAWQFKQNQADRHMSRQQFKRMVMMEKNSIRNKVRDAKAAGIHPLYAMGVAGPGISPTISAGGSAPMGSPSTSVPSAVISESSNPMLQSIVSAWSDKEARELQKQRMKAAQAVDRANIFRAQMAAERDWAEAQYLRSRPAREAQERNATGEGRLVDDRSVERAFRQETSGGGVRVEKPVVKSGRPGRPDVGGTEPALIGVRDKNGDEWLVPGDALSQAVEDLGPAIITGYVNRKKLKDKAWKWYKNAWAGERKPMGTRKSRRQKGSVWRRK